jgi:hypothetical protein
MIRLYIVAAAVIAAGATMNAAQIEIGQYAGNSASGADSGLTANYIGGTAACVGAVFQGNACAAGSAGGFTERNYAATMFSSASPMNLPFVGGTYAKTGGETAGSTMSDGSGNSFAMMADGPASGNSNNFWASGTGTNSIVIPVGLSGVDEVYTMMNNLWGTAGSNDTDITFTFDTTSSNGVGGVITNVTLDLTNSTYSVNNPYTGGAGTGQIRSATDCASGTTTTCANYGNGPLAANSVVNGIKVTTGTVFSQAYTSAAGNYAGTAGNLVLDDQGFNLSAYSGEYLVSITVQQNNGMTGSQSPTITGLSAITVDTAPEPSTVVLLLAGIGAIGLARIRTKKSLQS